MDIRARAADKQRDRDHDRERIARGELAKGDLRLENDFFAGIDFGGFRVVAIGKEPIGKAR